MIPHDAGLPESSSHLPFAKAHEAPPRRAEMPTAGYRTPPEPGAAPGLTAAPDLMALLAGLRQRWAAAVLVGGTLAAITGAAVWFLLAPKQTAFAQLQVKYTDSPILDSANHSPNDFKAVMTTTAGQVKSRRVIAAALKRDEVKRLGLDQQEKDAAQAITDDLQVEFKDNSELLTILYAHHDPKVASTVVNGIKEAYLEEILPALKRERGNKVTELEKAYSEAVDAIKSKKENLKKVIANLGTVDPKLWMTQRLELNQELKDAKAEWTKVTYELIKARSTLETIDDRIKAAKDRATGATPADAQALETALEEAMDKDADVKQLRQRLSHYEEKIDDYVNNRGFHPEYVTVARFRENADTARRMLSKRTEEIRGRVKKALARPATPTTPSGVDTATMRVRAEKEVNAWADLEKKWLAEIKRLSTKAAEIPVLGPEYEQMAEELKREEETLKTFGHRLDKERVEMRSAPRIRSFQDAELMKKEMKKQILAAGVSPLAVLGAVSMAFAWLECRKRRVHSAREISRGLGIRVVGAVPRMPHLERHLVTANGESELEGTPVMESIDAIRTRLLHEANTRSTRVVMVTSAGLGEGKTTLAAALATSLARAGRKTLLLDGDLRRPTVHELFEIAMQPGFSEVLLGEIEVAEAAQESPQENLSVIPAGQWDREVLLALSRGGLEGVFERLAEEFDFVIVDSHPVLSAADSLLIGRQSDAVLLSVLGGVSEMPRVYAASQQLAAVGVRVLGAVVNGTSPEEVYTSPPVAVGAA